jgi:hypothetical protein
MKTYKTYQKIFNEFYQVRNELIHFIKEHKNFNDEFKFFCKVLDEVDNYDLVDFTFEDDKVNAVIRENEFYYNVYLSFDKSLLKG